MSFQVVPTLADRMAALQPLAGFFRLRLRLQDDGYRPGAPSPRAAASAAAALAKARCPRCGCRGLWSVPHVRPGGSGYAVIAACLLCGFADLF